MKKVGIGQQIYQILTEEVLERGNTIEKHNGKNKKKILVDRINSNRRARRLQTSEQGQ
jgi:hypothetical protein